MNRKKILIAGKLPPPYFGTTVWFQTLQQAKWTDDFEMMWFNNNIHESLNTLGKIGPGQVWSNIKLCISFYRYIKAEKPDLILIPISQSTIGFLKDSLFIRIAKKHSATLVMLHGANWLKWLKASGSMTNSYVRRTLKTTKGVIVLGEKLKYLFEKFYDSKNVYVVPNGLNISHSIRIQKDDSKLIFTYLGNLLPAKGIKDVIEALVHLPRKHNYELQVIGELLDKSTKEYCERIITDHQLPVKFMGTLIGQEKMEALGNSDLFVFTPNEPEGHPLVIIEALAMGLPIISTNQGAISECVIDDVNGFLVETNSPKMISERINYFITNHDKLKVMGVESRKIYLEKFTEEKMIQNFEKVFRSVIS